MSSYVADELVERLRLHDFENLFNCYAALGADRGVEIVSDQVCDHEILCFFFWIQEYLPCTFDGVDGGGFGKRAFHGHHFEAGFGSEPGEKLLGRRGDDMSVIEVQIC